MATAAHRPSVYLLVVTALVLGLGIVGGRLLLGRETEEFTPPPAKVYPRADCGMPEITTALAHSAASSDSPRVGVGAIPAGFVPQQVVRCERGDDGAGNVTVDAVQLTGDVDAVTEAFRRRSTRPRGGVSVSCAVGGNQPAGLWLVAGDGTAVRPLWPVLVCGFHPEPLAPLKRLNEIGRTRVATLGPPEPAHCGTLVDSPAAPADRERSPERSEQDQAQARLAYLLPGDDADRVTMCRYVREGDVETLRDQKTLSLPESRAALVGAFAAATAPPCTQCATTSVTAVLWRPDGSGGGRFSAELDGCQRFSVVGVPGHRILPADVLTKLAE